MGRPRIHTTGAEKQRAYRARKAAEDAKLRKELKLLRAKLKKHPTRKKPK